MDGRETQESGADLLNATVRGDSIPQMKLAALDLAHELYGDGARLRIEHVGEIYTSLTADGGKFRTLIAVRCLDLPADDR